MHLPLQKSLHLLYYCSRTMYRLRDEKFLSKTERHFAFLHDSNYRATSRKVCLGPGTEIQVTAKLFCLKIGPPGTHMCRLKHAAPCRGTIIFSKGPHVLAGTHSAHVCKQGVNGGGGGIVVLHVQGNRTVLLPVCTLRAELHWGIRVLRLCLPIPLPGGSAQPSTPLPVSTVLLRDTH